MQDRISWHDYFMALAFLVAQRSPDPRTKHGSVLVDSKYHIIGTGYNGYPRGGASHSTYTLSPEEKYQEIIHSELNCLLNSTVSPEGATIYITGRPCVSCALAIVQSGVKSIIYGPVTCTMDIKWEKTQSILLNHGVCIAQHNEFVSALELAVTYGNKHRDMQGNYVKLSEQGTEHSKKD